ncbi:Homeodomain-like DNA binding domain-containing transcription factor [Phycomyces blakesleeanus]|uniref:Homeodomain-like DNA binding domain-containing transcription factor n=2 Tax=Phycomyces blakesleeanus TaxID=4837 RepID=A0A163AE34_PHYB8|nr:Homeodomain-like DNA binding domain-containing transcription factor [Phycomyces blakesleeanus NRRL 1555(-)]OAD72841.1 Homeodomain-like DNA binding domain-containing transcription factor [Phycomyces blakesleeanus NRRL 1555(-)]|eukprot:XP_018290881.1 Homeodomain-like DNA binding domain-containing transcription factor [Phycomyces blakesleeanus NRRL 1555(-)]
MQSTTYHDNLNNDISCYCDDMNCRKQCQDSPESANSVYPIPFSNYTHPNEWQPRFLAAASPYSPYTPEAHLYGYPVYEEGSALEYGSGDCDNIYAPVCDCDQHNLHSSRESLFGGANESELPHRHHHDHHEHHHQNVFRPAFYDPFEIKHRRRTSRSQFKMLEKTFSETPKPNGPLRRWLAQQLSMTPRGVQVWFQNRRAKAKLQKQQQDRRHHLRSTSHVSREQSKTESHHVFSPPYAVPLKREHSGASHLTISVSSSINDLSHYSPSRGSPVGAEGQGYLPSQSAYTPPQSSIERPLSLQPYSDCATIIGDDDEEDDEEYSVHGKNGDGLFENQQLLMTPLTPYQPSCYVDVFNTQPQQDLVGGVVSLSTVMDQPLILSTLSDSQKHKHLDQPLDLSSFEYPVQDQELFGEQTNPSDPLVYINSLFNETHLGETAKANEYYGANSIDSWIQTLPAQASSGSDVRPDSVWNSQSGAMPFLDTSFQPQRSFDSLPVERRHSHPVHSKIFNEEETLRRLSEPIVDWINHLQPYNPVTGVSNVLS